MPSPPSSHPAPPRRRYVIWPLRALPIAMARALGDVTATYRWFPVAYIIVMFFFVPGFFVVLSLISDVLVVTVGIVIALTIIFVSVVNYMQGTTDPYKLGKMDDVRVTTRRAHKHFPVRRAGVNTAHLLRTRRPRRPSATPCCRAASRPGTASPCGCAR